MHAFIARHPRFAFLAQILIIAVLALVTFPLNSTAQTPTTINIGSTAKMTSVKKLGINLGGQDFWDSRQMVRNIIFRNPGFEGETWQSIIHCVAVTTSSCTDGATSAVWTANFFQGATAEFITGAANGLQVNVSANTTAGGGSGVTLSFSQAPAGMAVGDYITVRKTFTGNGSAGWNLQSTGGAGFVTE